MSISSVSTTPVQQRPPAQQPPKGNDHDADDGATTSPTQQASKAPPAHGTGTIVDKTA